MTAKLFSDFLAQIERIHNDNSDKVILYRGQPADFPLIPSIARVNPKNDTTAIEAEMIAELKRRSRLKIKTKLIDDWDWLVYAQHFGLKTRLLDWTSNPLVGLWFACSNSTFYSSDGQLFVLIADEKLLLDREKDTSPFDRNKTRVYKPHLNNERIVAQDGWFTAHAFSTSSKLFVNLRKNSLLKKNLSLISIPAHSKIAFLKQLSILGMTYEKLFPDIEGLCKQLNYEYEM
ncbi:MAG: FRG domain-containing protein [Bacteroidetes bacterium]|nr:FRG domain-containing protein [Bacteroidota bacterium]MCL2303125.1 FRG domain-containing protein [Lentimicrobiaceae bacterium]